MGSEPSRPLDGIVSFAYFDRVPSLSSLEQCVSLDLVSTPIRDLRLSSPTLRRVRATFCDSLTKVNLSRLPQLEAVELVSDAQLRSVAFSGCPGLRALDISGSPVARLSGFESLEYLSAFHVPALELPRLPNLRYLDYLPEDVGRALDLELFPELEVLRLANCGGRHLLSVYSAHPTLRSVCLTQSDFVFDSLAPGTHLSFIALIGMHNVTGNVEVARGIFVARDGNKTNGVPFDPDRQRGYRWVDAARLLYGPWGVPAVDRKRKDGVSAVIEPPAGCNVNAALDGVIGSIVGGAVGDWIGVGTEFIDGCCAKVWLPEPIDVVWSHAKVWRHNIRFLRGTPTDDTSQAVLVMRAIVAGNQRKPPDDGKAVFHYRGVVVDTADFARRLSDWIEHGHREHKHPGGLGCGAATYKTVTNPVFETEPIAAAHATWVESNRQSAPNGSVMRISASGCFGFWDEELVDFIAEKFGKATHADPRCDFCARAAAALISKLLQKRSGLLDDFSIDATLEEVLARVQDADEHREVILRHCNAKTLDELELSGNQGIGYCLKCFGSTLWALRYAESYDAGIAAIVREGGDADTNGSVAGALLGAKFGFEGIGQQFREYCFTGQWLWKEITPYAQLMGFEMLPSPFLPW
jgi:ADP-ribosylglycohydrolase